MFFWVKRLRAWRQCMQDAIPWSIWAQAAVGIEQELLQISNLQHLQEKEAFANRNHSKSIDRFLYIRWFYVWYKYVKPLIRETFQVKITEETTTSSSRIFIKAMDRIQSFRLTPTRWSRWSRWLLCRSSFKNFQNSPGLKWNQLVKLVLPKEAQTEWPNEPVQEADMFQLRERSLFPLFDVWLRWGIKKLVDRLREEELKPFFVGLFPKDFDSHDLGTWRLKLCIWYRTTRRACVSPSTTSLRLVLESWQRSGVERQVEGNCP